MKVLFLDIDGVCNCVNTRARYGGYVGIDPVLAGRVKRIIAETGCEVVLSSVWRLTGDARGKVQQEVCSFMDVTPELSSGFRGDEVNTWLSGHPEVTTYAIVDDDNDFHSNQPLFRTTWATGITDQLADEVITYLNRVPS